MPLIGGDSWGLAQRGGMGLSATPERYGDPVGTKVIFDYFGRRLQPEFGIEDAIATHRARALRLLL